MAKGARQLVVQEALLETKKTNKHSHQLLDSSRFSSLHIQNEISSPKLRDTFVRIIKRYNVNVQDNRLPDNVHGGGVVFVLVNSHDKHWSIR